MYVNGKKVFAEGRWLRMAMVRSYEMMVNELENPELYIKKLREDGTRDIKADIFTFTQKIPATTPKYPYPMECESVAAIHLVTFTEWWESLPQETRKNGSRSQKRVVVISVKDFDLHLIEGIREGEHGSLLRQES